MGPAVEEGEKAPAIQLGVMGIIDHSFDINCTSCTDIILQAQAQALIDLHSDNDVDNSTFFGFL